jgi:hypothetical protein
MDIITSTYPDQKLGLDEQNISRTLTRYDKHAEVVLYLGGGDMGKGVQARGWDLKKVSN